MILAKLKYRLTRSALSSMVFIFAMLALYLIPGIIQSALVSHAPVEIAWAFCMFSGGLAGCIFLALGLGLPRIALELYVIVSGLAAWLLFGFGLPLEKVVWIGGAVPALLCALLLAAGVYLSYEEGQEAKVAARAVALAHG